MVWRSLLLALVLALAMPAGAEHAQGELQVSFDHRAGNEWWVEVVVEAGAGPIDEVEARDTGGPWIALEKTSWGAHAASFHVEPGHDVRFRATSGNEQVVSCWFVHPEGDEQCDQEPESPAFDHTGGNEWWVQVAVAGDPARVQAMDEDGPWVELEEKSWGDWAGSFHVAPGHDVRFRAMTDGAWHESCWFSHPEGQSSGGDSCGAAEKEPPATSGFDAQFNPKAGNEWWVEVAVEATQPLAGVDARDDGGQWVALEKKSWGAWANSFHVEDGSLVEFRATSRDGAQETSGQYRWPEATAVSAEPETADVAFGPKAGNEWWVETLVVFNGTVEGVEARADGGSWNELTLRDWGTWAGSFHAPAGSTVEFRATTDAGVDISDGFSWPQAQSGDGSWPEEGSYLQYETWYRPPGGYREEGTRTMVYHEGQWWSFAQWTESFDGEITGEGQQFADWRCPSYGPTEGVEVGDDVVFTHCRSDSNATVREMRSDDLRLDGDAATIDVWYGTDRDPCNCHEWQVAWDEDHGLVTYSNSAGRGSTGSELEDTDAPLGTSR